MNAARLVSCFTACLLIGGSALAQQKQEYPIAGACGALNVDFSVKSIKQPKLPMQPPSGRALVYLIESMPDVGVATRKVNIGLDGNWLGATDANDYISIPLAPGVHHFCAIYQGKTANMENGDEALFLHLDVRVGKTYYLHYKGFFLKDAPSVAFFQKVDDDEGTYLLARSSLAVSKLKK